MPDPDRFTEETRTLGVDDGHTVVVHDGAGVHSGARAWWMLRAMGFDRAAVLDGGLPAWTDTGLPLESAVATPAPPRGDFTARPRPDLVVGAAEVRAALSDPASAVLDARSRERFSGAAPEPRPGLRGGHMPGAVNLPITEIQHGGRMLPADDLRAAFASVTGDRDRLYLSCGSGVTACVPALGAEIAGHRRLAVYDGSWSEWGLRSDLPVVHGEAPGGKAVERDAAERDARTGVRPDDLTPEERAWLREAAAWGGTEGAYAAMHRTKVQTAAFGLTDSPAGLAAWIVEKLRGWSDCGGDIERSFTKDEILTNVTLYWLTGTIGSAMRVYAANAAIPPTQLARRVEVPSGFALFPGDVVRPPRAWLERTTNAVRVTEPARGGHFAAFEEPELFAEELRAFFRPYRQAASPQG